MALKNVLFIGRANATCSVMAEAYMNHAGRGLYRAFSAGLAPAGEAHPLTLETLRDAGVRGRSFSSKSWRIFAVAAAPRMDVVVGIGDAVVPPDMPQWSRDRDVRHWALDDPTAAPGSESGQRMAFLDCFAQIRQHVDALLLAHPPLVTLMERAARGEVVEYDVAS